MGNCGGACCAGSDPNEFKTEKNWRSTNKNDQLERIKASGKEDEVVKIQSHARGFLQRKQIPSQIGEIFDSGELEINKEIYNNPNIMEIRRSLAQFHFGNENADDGVQRSLRPIVMLENGAKYEGEW